MSLVNISLILGRPEVNGLDFASAWSFLLRAITLPLRSIQPFLIRAFNQRTIQINLSKLIAQRTNHDIYSLSRK